MTPGTPPPEIPVLVQRPGAPSGHGGGRLKALPGDFQVEEIPAYAPTGDGAHLFVQVRKTDVSGPFMVRTLAKRWGVSTRDIGVAGVKDRRAVTTQWVSLPNKDQDPARLAGEVGQGGLLEVLDAVPHTQKLRTGHLHGNQFTVVLRERSPEDDHGALAALTWYGEHGFPNAYGWQRFSDDALREGQQILGREQGMRSRRDRFAVSAMQSLVFNKWLLARNDGLGLGRVQNGDVLKRRDSGGVFVSDDAMRDQARLDGGELVLTGPLPGGRPSGAHGAALVELDAATAKVGIPVSAFRGLGKKASGSQRPALAWPSEAQGQRTSDGLMLSFGLPAGSYATVLLALICGGELAQGPAPAP